MAQRNKDLERYNEILVQKLREAKRGGQTLAQRLWPGLPSAARAAPAPKRSNESVAQALYPGLRRR